MSIITIHEWPLAVGKEIVDLFYDGGVLKHLWRGNEAAKFRNSPLNILKLWVEYRYQKPPGGIAHYIVIIERETATGWEELVKDDVTIVQRDDELHGLQKDYNLWVPRGLFLKEDIIFRFKINTWIQLYSQSGDDWSFDDKIYTATFKKPTLRAVEASVVSIHDALDQELRVYRREMRARRSKRSKRKRTK